MDFFLRPHMAATFGQFPGNLRFSGALLREDNKIKFNICGFKKEDTGHTDRSLSGQSLCEMKEHVKTDHNQAFDDEVID